MSPFSTTRLSGVSLPYLEVLDIFSVYNGLPLNEFLSDSSFPRLHSASIAVGWPTPALSISFWKRFGSQIRTLFIRNKTVDTPDLLTEGSDLEELLRLLPNLEQLILESIPDKDLFEGAPLSSTVKTLELQIHHDDSYTVNPFNLDIRKPGDPSHFKYSQPRGLPAFRRMGHSIK